MTPHQDQANLFKGLVCGVTDYFNKSNFSKAVIGLSGGIDSALVYVLLVAALGSDNVQPIFLPSSFTSNQSFIDARRLSNIFNSDLKTFALDEPLSGVRTSLPKSFF